MVTKPNDDSSLSHIDGKVGRFLHVFPNIEEKKIIFILKNVQ